MAVCGVSLNLSSLTTDIASKVGIVLDLSGLIGTPPGLAALQGALAGAVATLKASVANLIPDIPLADDLLSLRGQLEGLAGQLSGDVTGAINGLLGDFGDAINIDGFANLNLNDLAATALRLGAGFNPCDLASGIPNIIKDGAGNIFNAPEPPFKGVTMPAARNLFGSQVFEDFGLAEMQNNITDFSSLPDIPDISSALDLGSISTITDAFENNVSPNISAFGTSIKKLSSGETVLQSMEDYLQEQVSFRKAIFEEG